LLAELLSSDSQLRSFVDGIISHVQAQGYDGLVLEVGAVWALEHLIKELSEALHAHDKVLGIVLPPFRRIKEGEEAGDEARMNVIALQAYKALSPLVDLSELPRRRRPRIIECGRQQKLTESGNSH